MYQYIFLILISVTIISHAEPQQTYLSASFSTNTYTRYTQFINTLTKEQSDKCRTVHSSGGAAGGIISEGQGYGLFMAAATAASLGTSHSNFATVRDQAYAIFKGWKRMCKMSKDSGHCQNTFYCSENGATYPCLPHWKFADDFSSIWGTGSAPDGDIDAIAGMILLVGITESSKTDWWSEVANWCYDSIIQFYTSSVQESGSNSVLKLGACWGGLDCNNPSYHAPGQFRAARNFLTKYGTALGRSASQVKEFVDKYNKLIATSYKILLSNQNDAGLTTNWYVPNSGDISAKGSTGCSGSGTPAAEYGAEAARGVWRVAVDYLWYPNEATESTKYLDKIIKQLSTKFTGSGFNNLDTGGFVTNIFSDWLGNSFIYGPTFCALIKPLSGISNQQAALNWAASKVNGGPLNDYYAGSWTAIATLTLSGDLYKSASLVGTGSTTPPPTTPPPTTPPPTTPPPTTPPPTTPPPTTPPPTTPPPTTPPPTTPPPTTPPPTTPPPSNKPKCTISGCTVSDKTVEYIVTGATVTSSEVQCGSTRYKCTAVNDGTGKYRCTLTVTCSNPIPFVNGAACPITLNTASQSCKPVLTNNNWWVEWTPPGTGWSEKLASIKCADGRYFACPNNYGNKVACPIADRECASVTALYGGAPCPWASSLVEDGVSNSSSTPLSAGAIVGIVVALVVLVVVIVAVVVLKKKLSDKEETV